MFPQKRPCSLFQIVSAKKRLLAVFFPIFFFCGPQSMAVPVLSFSPWDFLNSLNIWSITLKLDANHPLIGNWKFERMILDGQEAPAPNPKLHLFFDFFPDQVVRLFYYRTDERGFCERLGRYSFQDPILYQEITWVNPKNNDSCAQDTDMRLGVSYTTYLRFRNKDLLMKISMPEGELYFVFEKQLTSSRPPPTTEAPLESLSE